MSSDETSMGVNIEWCLIHNKQLRMEGEDVPGQTEVNDVLQRAMSDLLVRNGIQSVVKATLEQIEAFYRAVDGAPLQEDHLRELNRHVQEFGPHQVIALIISSIFMIDIKLDVADPIWPSKVTWSRAS